jgi:7-cyano-7-deazaguanine synthase
VKRLPLVADTRPRAVVLLSGGLDSAVALAQTAADGFACIAVVVDYGQRNADRELTCARMQAGAHGARAVVIDLSSLRLAQRGGKDVSPHYVPGRNSVLVSLALSAAEVHDAERVVIGATAEDLVGFPDCRPAFFDAWRAVARVGMARAPEIVTPLLAMSKADVVRAAAALGVDPAPTWSCYGGGPAPCGACGACVVRARGFAEAGIADPLMGDA